MIFDVSDFWKPHTKAIASKFECEYIKRNIMSFMILCTRCDKCVCFYTLYWTRTCVVHARWWQIRVLKIMYLLLIMIFQTFHAFLRTVVR